MYGITLVDAGVPVGVVCDLMGQCSVTVAERYTEARSQAQHFGAVTAALQAARRAPAGWAAGWAAGGTSAGGGTPQEPRVRDPHERRMAVEALAPGIAAALSCAEAAA